MSERARIRRGLIVALGHDPARVRYETTATGFRLVDMDGAEVERLDQGIMKRLNDDPVFRARWKAATGVG